MKILFVGTRLQGYYIEEEASSRGWKLDYVETSENMDLQDYQSDILAACINGYDFIIYDTTSCITEADILAYMIHKIRETNKIKPIVVVNTISEKNVVVAACINQQIRAFINKGSGTVTDHKEQFINNVTSYYENVGRSEVEEVETKVRRSNERTKNIRTIGVAGTCRRIGTTTQSLQIAKYLKYKGYKACVIEMNNIKYPNVRQRHNKAAAELSFFEKTKLFLETEIDEEELGYMRIDGVDIYYKPEKLSEICEKGYDFHIFDYGAYSHNAFNKTAFLKDEIQIIVAGSDIAEMDCVIDIADNSSYKDAKFIFSFTDEASRDDVKIVLNEFDGKDKCFFAGYSPDPYTLTDYTMYDKLFKIEEKESENKTEEKGKAKKKGFLRRR